MPKRQSPPRSQSTRNRRSGPGSVAGESSRTTLVAGPSRRTIWLVSLAVAWIAVVADLLAVVVHAPQYATFLILGVAAFGIAGVVFASRRGWLAAIVVVVGVAFVARGVVGAF
jgi:hypothetical protein